MTLASSRVLINHKLLTLTNIPTLPSNRNQPLLIAWIGEREAEFGFDFLIAYAFALRIKPNTHFT